MESTSSKLVAAFLLSMIGAAAAHAEVTVKDPWVRATVAQQRVTGAFMELSSTEAVRVVEVRSTAAKVVEIHQMLMDNNVMKMQAVPALELKPGKVAELKPGGYHIMLIDLVKPLSAGDSVPLTLVVEGADKKLTQVQVKADVRALGSRPAAGAASADPHAGHKH
jgi:periplasmic copper chaperone A